MHLKRGLRVGRPFGIPLLVHGSWLPAAVLLVSHFALTIYGDLPLSRAITLGILTAFGFFASLVAHELGHALMARSLGIGVRDIILFIFGGVARIAREPSRPAQEVVIALAGPFVSGALGVAFLATAGSLSGEAAVAVRTLGAANVTLALFNLVPGFPLDGGRLLRAWLWARSGDPHRAALGAGRAGQLFGLALVIAGLVLFGVLVDFETVPDAAAGVWLAVVGAFLYALATASRRAARLAALVGSRPAGMWARPFGGTLDAEMALSLVRPGGPYAVADGGRLAGVLLKAQSGTGAALVREAMVPWTPRLTVAAGQPLARALERLASTDLGVLVVVDEGGSAVGVLDHDGVRARLRSTAR